MVREIIVMDEGLVAFRTLMLSGFVVDSLNMTFERVASVNDFGQARHSTFSLSI